MSARQPPNIQPKRILVITLRYLGDTLLVTPLISSLKKAYPKAEIDVLLPAGNLGMFEGNPDVNRLIPMTDKADKAGFVKLLLSLWRRYDLSISTQAGDRPVLCAVLSGRFSIGFVTESTAKYSWKFWLLSRVLLFGAKPSHTVLENLRFCRLLGILPCYQLTPPRAESKFTPLLPVSKKYAVMHIMPQWRYKQWHDQGWVKIGAFLNEQGYVIILTGSSQPEEQRAIKRIQSRLSSSTLNLAGKLTLSQLTSLIENATLFIGPDTGITHLAAATGVPTFAIFGPSNPEQWAPWPFGYAQEIPPFAAVGSQRNQNVWLIQGKMEQGCVPCQLEGCNRNQQSFSACLDGLSAETVIHSLRQCI